MFGGLPVTSGRGQVGAGDRPGGDALSGGAAAWATDRPRLVRRVGVALGKEARAGVVGRGKGLPIPTEALGLVGGVAGVWGRFGRKAKRWAVRGPGPKADLKGGATMPASRTAGAGLPVQDDRLGRLLQTIGDRLAGRGG